MCRKRDLPLLQTDMEQEGQMARQSMHPAPSPTAARAVPMPRWLCELCPSTSLFPNCLPGRAAR